ncbi:MAG: hypothetical protein ACOH2M_27080 [Cypionkella sp.]
MDRTVPPAAASLLAFIARTETSRDFPDAYEVIYGHNQAKLPKRLTSMTLAEVQAAQGAWSKAYGSSATGAYQFMRTTLGGLMTELKLRPGQILDGNLQDRLAYHLLKRRGYDAWTADKISDTEFAKRLAMEWASFPVLTDTKGAHRNLTADQSYYAGDGVNKALVAPQTVRNELNKARAALKGGVSVAPAPTPSPIPVEPLPEPAKGKGPPWGIIIVVLIGLAAAGLFFVRF